MSILRRIKALEHSFTPPEPGQRVWLDHEPTHEILGVSWCQGHEPKHVNRRPGETIQKLKDRCLHAAKNVRAGLVFFMDYGPARVPTRCDNGYPVQILEVDNESC